MEHIFTNLDSTDTTIIHLQKKIEKFCHLQMWVGKALSLIERYKVNLYKLDSVSDPVERGKLVEDVEISFMSSVSFFLRCFMSQQSLYLEINKVTKEEKLRDCYKLLMAIRNDEFVHWKGAQSGLKVFYSFKALSTTEIEFAKDIQIQFDQRCGPGDIEAVKELYKITVAYLEVERNSSIERLRKELMKPEVFMKSQLYNENGEPLIIKPVI